MEHDQRFKTLIRTFFESFLRLFFPEQAARIDFSNVEWLDKELLPDPPEGERHIVDLLARVRVVEPVDARRAGEPEPWLVCVHVEVESPDRTTGLKDRLPFYYFKIRERYGLPVLPIVIYLKVGLEGIGIDDVVESFFGLEVVRFQYRYVGLPALNAVEYLEGQNWLGVALAALMRIPPGRSAWIGAEALRKIAESGLNDTQKLLLGDCVEAYIPLDAADRENFRELLLQSNYEGVPAMNKTTYDLGIEKGIEKGQALGQISLLQQLIQRRFGGVNESTKQYLNALDPNQICDLTLKIATATKWEDVGIPR